MPRSSRRPDSTRSLPCWRKVTIELKLPVLPLGPTATTEHCVLALADGVHRPAVPDHAVHLPGRGEGGVDAVQVERVEVAGVVVLARRGDRAAAVDSIVVATGQPAREQAAARVGHRERLDAVEAARDDPSVRRAGRQVELVGRGVGQVRVDGQAAGRRGVRRGGVEADDGDGAERRAVVRDGDLVAAEHRLVGTTVERGAREPVLDGAVLDDVTVLPGGFELGGVVVGLGEVEVGQPGPEHQAHDAVVQPRGDQGAVVLHRVGDLGGGRVRDVDGHQLGDRPATAPVGATLRHRDHGVAGEEDLGAVGARGPGQVERREPLDLGAAHVVGDQVAVLDPEQRCCRRS